MQITALHEQKGSPSFVRGPKSGGRNGNGGGRHRGKSKVMEQIDLFLEGMSLYRKQTARDATCLFRAVSEQLFYSQCFHYSVRLSCIHFMERNRNLFPDKIDGELFDDHVRRMRNPREWGGTWEMQAMAILYKRDFIIFNDINTAPVQVTDNKFIDKFLLCRIGTNHYDSVFVKSFIDNSALCQGLIYELLYGKVFGMQDIDTAIQVMLYEGKQSKETFEPSTLLQRKEPIGPNSVINVLVKGGTPFPYKVAKALDPRMYRNVEYDLWNDERKEMKKNNVFHNEILQIGSKCLVTVKGTTNHQYPAYIQDMEPNKGPVSVFVEVLGERCTVPYESIEPIVLPMSPSNNKTRCICINGTQIQTHHQSSLRFRRYKTSRFQVEKANVSLRHISEKINCSSTVTLPSKLQTTMDLNNNQTTMMIWSHNTANISTSQDSNGHQQIQIQQQQLESRDTHCITTLDNAPTDVPPPNHLPPMIEPPFYLMTTSPPSPPQWSMYPSVPPCPLPQVTYAQPQQQQQPMQPAIQQQQQMPTPLYVTFSDGTTILVPNQRLQDSTQHSLPPQMMYHFDPSGAPPAQFPPLPFSLSMHDMDQIQEQQQQQQQQQNNIMSLEQQLLLHHRAMESSTDVNRCIGFDVSVPFNMQMPNQYWGGQNEQQQQQQLAALPTSLYPNPPPPPPLPPLHHRPQQTNQQHNSAFNGEMGPMTIFFSPPYPYQVSH